MSLKTLHLVFIACSTLLTFGFGIWSVGQFLDKRGGLYLLAGVVAFGAGAGLIRYGIVVYRKLKNMPWM